MANNRIFYACQSVQLGSTNLKGVQSVGLNSTFNFEQVFQLGQVEIYENVEGVPEVEVTIERALDGNSSLYSLFGTQNSLNPGSSLVTASDAQKSVILSVFPDTGNSSSAALLNVEATGMFMSNWSCNVNLDGPSTESMSLVGNHQNWSATSAAGDVSGSEGTVIKRHGLSSSSTLPYGTDKLQSISVSVDFGREDLQQLGDKYPYFKAATFPTEVTSEFAYLADETFDAPEIVGLGGTTTEKNKDVTCKENIIILLNSIDPNCSTGGGSTLKYTIALGDQNRLTGAQFGGGDAGGGNATITYSFSTYNELAVVTT